jgi:hypothetical protein
MADPNPARSLDRPDLLVSSRLATFTAFGAAFGALPLPFVPASLRRALRGALVHDVAARHGLSLSADARELLAAPSSEPEAGGRWVSGAAGFLARRVASRLGPLALLPPVRAALETFALGVLFERYARSVRRDPSVRVDAAEARRARELIDRAVVRAFHPDLRPSEGTPRPRAPEDFRDDMTRVVDTVLLAGADLPSYLIRRLEGAFDAVVAENPELAGD